MSSKLALEVITRLEAAFPVHRWRVDGVEVWPALRIWLGIRLLNPAMSKDGRVRGAELSPARRMGRKLRQALAVSAAYVRDREKNQRLDRHYPIVMIMASGNRRVRLSTGWYAIYSDPFVERYRSMGMETLTLERAVNGYRIPRHSRSCFVSPAPPWLRVTRRRGRHVKTSEDSYLEGLSEVRRLVELDHGVSIPDARSLESIAGEIRRAADTWVGVFERVRPRVGFTVCYYNVDGFGFNLACREFGIPSVDIQHGVQGSLHYAYGQWTNLPAEGYSLLPTYFWCWTDADVAAIQSWSGDLSRHQALRGGNLWLDVWRERQDEFDPGVREELAAVRARADVHVLYTCDRNPELPPQLLKAMQQASPTWLWWIRMHPGMDERQRQHVMDQLHAVRSESVEAEIATRVPLPLLLGAVDVHVTRYSTVVVEAEAAGVGSIILDVMGEEYYRRQIESGSARAARVADDLLEGIEHFLHSAMGTGGAGMVPGDDADAMLRELAEDGLARSKGFLR